MPQGNTTTRSNGQSTSASTSRKAADRLHDGIDRAAEAGERLESNLRKQGAHLGAKADQATKSLKSYMHEKPWVVLGSTIAIGFLLGSLSRRK